MKQKVQIIVRKKVFKQNYDSHIPLLLLDIWNYLLKIQMHIINIQEENISLIKLFDVENNNFKKCL